MVDIKKWQDRIKNLLQVQKDLCLEQINTTFTRNELIELRLLLNEMMEIKNNNRATEVTVAESEDNMTTYLLPTVLTGKNLPMEYRIVECKRDMRTRFCKENEKYIIDRDTLNEYIREYGIRVKGDRVMMKDGKQARIFHVLVR